MSCQRVLANRPCSVSVEAYVGKRSVSTTEEMLSGCTLKTTTVLRSYHSIVKQGHISDTRTVKCSIVLMRVNQIGTIWYHTVISFL